MTANEAIEAIGRGERVKGPCSIHDKETPTNCPQFVHQWRVLYCNDETDVVECSRCGKQNLAVCDFDDDFA